MGSQDDYGKPDSPEIQLVPDTLRTYRHFGLFKGTLWPMSTSVATAGNPYALTTADNDPNDETVIGCTCIQCEQKRRFRDPYPTDPT